ncbi:MAG: hypothetical protein ABSA70_10960, partial [Terriglobia bacterium]
MSFRKAFLWIFVAGLLAYGAEAVAAKEAIVLNEKEYFEGPGFSFLVFHNNYQVGFQGGLQMIQNGERILDSGDFLLTPKSGGMEGPELRVLRRVVDRERSTATVYGEIGGWNTGYQLICRTDGERIFITLKLDRPIDWSKVERAGFRMCLYPYTGQMIFFGPTKTLRVAQEDPLHSFVMSRADGALLLIDPRQDGPEPWFFVLAPLEAGSQETEVRLEITPSLRSDWRRPPVIGISQVGYHPNQVKRAVLELDPRDSTSAPVNLYQLELAGDKKL